MILFIILYLCSFLGLVMSLVFLFKKEEDNKIFSFFLFLFSYNILFNILYWTSRKEVFFAYFQFTYLIPLSLYGSLFYLYLRVKIDNIKIGLKDVKHFIPFIVTMVLYGGYYFLKPSLKIELFKNKESFNYIIHFRHYEEVLILTLTFYTIFSYLKFKNKYRNDAELNIWFKLLTFGFFGFTFSYILYDILAELSLLKVEYDYIITFMMILFIFIVAYLNYSYPAIFNGKPLDKAIPFVKYEKTGLDESTSVKIKNELEKLMKIEKPYLNAELKLNDIARSLNISRHHASQVINKHFESNFFDFINTYRVTYAKSLLENKNSNYTISEIAYESGFNNRASFYKSFKKNCSITPSEYKRGL